MIRLILIFLFALFLSVPAHAQQEHDEICLSIAYIWSGSEIEKNEIEKDPVPDSFRKHFEQTGCSRFSLRETSLLDWHTRFGNDQTMKQAVDYITTPARLALNSQLSDNPKWQQAAYASLAYYYLEAAKGFQTEELYSLAAEYASKAMSSSDVSQWPSFNFHNPKFSYSVSSDLGIRSLYVKKLSPITADILAGFAFVTGEEVAILEAEKLIENYNLEAAMRHVINEENAECKLKRGWNDNEEFVCDIIRDGRKYIFDYSSTKAIIEVARYKAGLIEKPPYQALHDAILIAKIYNIHEEWQALPKQKLANLYLVFADSSYTHAKQVKQEPKNKLLQDCIKFAEFAARFSPEYKIPSQWQRAADQYVKCANALKAQDIQIDESAYRYFDRRIAK